MQLGLTYYRENASFAENLYNKFRFKKQLLRLAKKYNIEGFTLLKALGAWQGKTEPSYQLIIENVPERTVRALASDCRDTFKQDSVMLKNGRKVDFI